jgi:hypothetical protein
LKSTRDLARPFCNCIDVVSEVAQPHVLAIVAILVIFSYCTALKGEFVWLYDILLSPYTFSTSYYFLLTFYSHGEQVIKLPTPVIVLAVGNEDYKGWPPQPAEQLTRAGRP